MNSLPARTHNNFQEQISSDKILQCPKMPCFPVDMGSCNSLMPPELQQWRAWEVMGACVGLCLVTVPGWPHGF